MLRFFRRGISRDSFRNPEIFRKNLWTGNRFLFILLILAGMGITSCEDLLTDLDGADPRDKLVDTWKVEDTADAKKSAMEVYWVKISKHPFDSGKIMIDNFYHIKSNAEAVLNGTQLNLPLQELEGGFTIRGTGVIQGSKANGIIWNYTVDDGSGAAETISERYTRLTF